MLINHRIRVVHNFHNKGRARISVYNLLTGTMCRSRYVEDTKEAIEKEIEICKGLVSGWDGQVVQVLES